MYKNSSNIINNEEDEKKRIKLPKSNALPHEIWLQIFSYLSPPELFIMAKVNKTILELIAFVVLEDKLKVENKSVFDSAQLYILGRGLWNILCSSLFYPVFQQLGEIGETVIGLGIWYRTDYRLNSLTSYTFYTSCSSFQIMGNRSLQEEALQLRHLLHNFVRYKERINTGKVVDGDYGYDLLNMFFHITACVVNSLYNTQSHELKYLLLQLQSKKFPSFNIVFANQEAGPKELQKKRFYLKQSCYQILDTSEPTEVIKILDTSESTDVIKILDTSEYTEAIIRHQNGFQNIPFFLSNLSGISWPGKNLKDLHLQGINFECAELMQADLRATKLQEVNLRKANLQEANLMGACWHKVDLQRANLHKAGLSWACFTEVNLEGADLRTTDLQFTYWSEANLQGANLKKAYLQQAKFDGVNLQGANLQYANLQKTRFDTVNLQGANLQYANLQEANLQGVDLRGADLRWANLQGAKLENVKFEGAKLGGINFRLVMLGE